MMRPAARRFEGIDLVMAVVVAGLSLAVACAMPADPPSTRHADAVTRTADERRRQVTLRPGDVLQVGLPAGADALRASGPLEVTEPGAVIEDLDVAGSIVVAAPDVTIRRVRLTGDGQDYGVQVVSGSATVSDCEIRGTYEVAGIGGDGWTMRGCELHDLSSDGAKLGNHVLVEGCWFHDDAPPPGGHTDSIQLESGVVDATVRRNVIESRGNSAVFLAPDLGPSSAGPVVIEENRLSGGNYTLYNLDGDRGRYRVDTVVIRGNRFGRDARYGAANSTVPATWSANVWDDDGSPLAGQTS